MNDIGKNIKKIRVEKGLSQEELGIMIGADANRVYKIESGMVLKPRNLPEIAKALEVSVDELLTECEQSPNTFTGQQLKLRRISLGLTIQKLANLAGVSTSVIRKMESDEIPNTKFLPRILSVLQMKSSTVTHGVADIEKMTIALEDCVDEAAIATRFVLKYMKKSELNLSDPESKELFTQYLRHSFYSKFTGDNKKFNPAELDTGETMQQST